MKVHEILARLNQIAPAEYAFSWDKVGLQVGSTTDEIVAGVTCLDLTPALAMKLRPNTLVIAHHPLIFRPMERVMTDRPQGKVITQLLTKRCAFVACHTNWDVAEGGINDTLAARLDLVDVTAFGIATGVDELKLVTFAPSAAIEPLIDALSAAGAGVIGDYSRCAFTSKGTGTFLGNEHTNPTVGSRGQIESVEEIRLEMRVPASQREAVEATLRRTHPYEEPARDWYSLAESSQARLGRLGALQEAMSLEALRSEVERRLQTRCQALGPKRSLITRLAVVGGSGAEEWRAAQRAGAQALLTGEVAHHVAVEANAEGFALLEAGHFATEYPGMDALAARLSTECPEIPWKSLKPAKGTDGFGW